MKTNSLLNSIQTALVTLGTAILLWVGIMITKQSTDTARIDERLKCIEEK